MKGGGGVEENRNEQVKQSYYVKTTKVGERRDSMETLQAARLVEKRATRELCVTENFFLMDWKSLKGIVPKIISSLGI